MLVKKRQGRQELLARQQSSKTTDTQSSVVTFDDQTFSGIQARSGTFSDQGLRFDNTYLNTVAGNVSPPSGVKNGTNFIMFHSADPLTVSTSNENAFSLTSLDLGLSY